MGLCEEAGCWKMLHPEQDRSSHSHDDPFLQWLDCKAFDLLLVLCTGQEVKYPACLCRNLGADAFQGNNLLDFKLFDQIVDSLSKLPLDVCNSIHNMEDGYIPLLVIEDAYRLNNL